MQDNREKFNEAVKNDIGRSPLENEIYARPRQIRAKLLILNRLETFVSLAEVKQSFDNVKKWSKPESAPLSFYCLTSPKIRKEAKGVVLIFFPFDFPILLLMNPIVSVVGCAKQLQIFTQSQAGAIAAGNAVCVKTSELLPSTSSLLAELFPRYLDQDLYRVVTGEIPVSTRLLALRWDHSQSLSS